MPHQVGQCNLNRFEINPFANRRLPISYWTASGLWAP